ncbi:hypothetical protein D3C86_1516000 [compost metagenome]
MACADGITDRVGPLVTGGYLVGGLAKIAKNVNLLIRMKRHPQYPPCHPLCSTSCYHLPSSCSSCPRSWPPVLSIRSSKGRGETCPRLSLVHLGCAVILLSYHPPACDLTGCLPSSLPFCCTRSPVPLYLLAVLLSCCPSCALCTLVSCLSQWGVLQRHT